MTPTPPPSAVPPPAAPPFEAVSLGPPGVALILSGVSRPSAARPVAEEERADAAVVARAEARGELVRLRAGVHVRRTEWEAVSARGRHLLRIRALARVALDPVVLGGASAAAVHGLPRLAPWPALVTLLEAPGLRRGRPAGTRVVRDPAHGRSRLVLGAEAVRLPGLAATALAASHEAAMAAVRGTAPRGPGWYAHGLVALDHALAPTRRSPVTRADLDREWGMRGSGPWSRRAELLVRAADGAACCPLESVARGVAHEVGLAPPAVGVAVGGHGRLALAWAAQRVGLRIVGRGCAGRVAPGADADAGHAGQREVGRWRVVVAGEGDVLGAGRLRALLLHAGLEPERRAARAARG
ncbi:hypothetical protein [Clavibacter nebraskensis]|uniref:Uncharacterized protein n=2 Tax=Clavibacter nebraskensis TaxID=31963 RepID=A0ABY4MQ98_9MICO|nr:hypothetical protein [Clavibacter nebraskensis]QGV67583.1 hypothetical protein EGX36_12575 [Clavibacter nebraskensis]QGV70382.1 hypothetical protein EGX37_12530 [Clavibacter nebraskensis]QGV73173.1 hypothetical protein EGX35_12530 [Clavibacter nebraskensis]UKF28820.1 hypothetical protein FGQ65_11815 [Clavibacter nebraskensis]UQB04655.1 hypothetical protein LIV34_002513 [Clavibacter nebraskensis]